MIRIIVLIGLTFSCNNNSKNRESDGSMDIEVTDNYAESLANELSKLYEQGHINGFAVAITNQNKVLYLNGFGFSDISTKKGYTPNTIQNIGSVSKTLIGIALLKAQEQKN